MTTGRGGRPCRVCTHPRRGEIDAALRNGARLPELVDVFGLPKENIRRHAKNHLRLDAQAPDRFAENCFHAAPDADGVT